MSHTDEQATFYANIDARRRDLGLSWREVSRQAGVGVNVPTRLRDGLGVSGASVFRLRVWLRRNVPQAHSRAFALVGTAHMSDA